MPDLRDQTAVPSDVKGVGCVNKRYNREAHRRTMPGISRGDVIPGKSKPQSRYRALKDVKRELGKVPARQ